ncbi:Hpt domain-containing protein [Chitinimonas sp. BJYL2]|uniref:Hpt domain-containing protein n=1 Tax=Chitinimonas sp. BJYL2 TaxID=2976696 RepID=UPI0022B38A54|nr:Hpt domain-containing protein [Chitinimonas sp. BJYL2]
MSDEQLARKARLAAALSEVRRDFEARLPDDVSQLLRLLDEGQREAAHALAHRLAGAGKLFGHPEVTDLARQLEGMLTPGEPAPDQYALQQLLHALLQSVR